METAIDTEINKGLPYGSGDKSNNGYRSDEATQFIEFCVELDNQDDRLKNKDNKTLYPNIDPQLWNPEPIFDSRLAVAKGVLNFRTLDGHAKEMDPWHKLYKKIIARADSKYPQGWEENTIFSDPDLNGFGPWQNAWLLYEGQGAFKGAYAIAIRGTVFSNVPSAAEDAFSQPVSARNFLSKYVQFADSNKAALHSGFAHAAFTLLLDDRHGILRVLNDNGVPAHSRLFIIGHSQGAAMATIVHAFMYYALRNDDAATQPVFGLKGKDYRLKSYGFAQPKPGNYAFSSDFARITQNEDNAIVINNYIDPVPKVPLTLQSTGDLDNDFKGSSFLVRVVHFVSGFGSVIRGAVSSIAEPFVRKSAIGYGYFYNYQNIKPIGHDITATSWDFVPAGHVLMVFGTPGDPRDPFLQHHATTYRALIGEQLKY